MNQNVIDVSRDSSTGDITQFTVVTDGGIPRPVKGTKSNFLLYDPEDDLPFEGGMWSLFEDGKALRLGSSPDVLVAQTNNKYCYVLRVRDSVVETTAKQSGRALSAIKDALVSESIEPVLKLHQDILKEQVRHNVMKALKETFDGCERISITSKGWLIDGFYLVDWSASMYTRNDERDSSDVRRSGSNVVETDRSHEFIEGTINRDVSKISVGIAGETYVLSEREMLFLTKVEWLLNRREHHPDKPFWKWNDKRATVDAETGEPEETEESEREDDTSFNL